jgi:hypothetical protein
MNPAPFVHSALAMKRRDRCPARLALGCLEVAPKRTCRAGLTMSAPVGKTDVPRGPGHFRFWHETDSPAHFVKVRSWGKSGRHLLVLSVSQFDPQRTSTERAHEQHRSQLRAESFADFTTWVEISRSVQ